MTTPFRTLLLLMLIALPPAVTAQSLATLFTTPAQREHLDALRARFMDEEARGSFDIDQQVDLPPVQETTPPAEILFHLSGIMTRSDGSRVVWLNDAALTARDLPDGFRLREDGRALLISTRGTTYTLLPGQTIDLQDGAVREAYEGGREAASPDPSPAGPDNSTAAPDSTTPGLMDTLRDLRSPGPTGESAP